LTPGPGALIKTRTNPTVYLIISNGTKYAFKSAAEFLGFGFRFNLVQEAADTELQSIPDASIASLSYHPTGQFVKYQGSPAVYKIENNLKRAVPSMEVLRTHMDPFRIIIISESFQYASGADLGLAEGSLVKGSGATVYLIENGQKRGFSSAAAFLGQGYGFGQIRAVLDSELAKYAEGEQY
jgi:hypothetical protein